LIDELQKDMGEIPHAHKVKETIQKHIDNQK
jgi:hypothetical protein